MRIVALLLALGMSCGSETNSGLSQTDGAGLEVMGGDTAAGDGQALADGASDVDQDDSDAAADATADTAGCSCDGLECGENACGEECGTCPQAAPHCVEGICEIQAPCVGPTLRFALQVGDDGVSCEGVQDCTIWIGFEEHRQLQVVYEEGCTPTAGQAVKFALETDPDGIGFISTLTAITDQDGVAVNTTKAHDAAAGQYSVKAYIDGAPLIPALYFRVVVSP